MSNFIKSLSGYQNSNPELSEPGVVIGFEGKPYNINELTPDLFSKENLARCLSRESRYVGNTHQIYSVAQHCVAGAEAFLLMGRPHLAFIFLVHDGSEIILRDMTKPIKNLLKEYEELQERIDQYIAGVYKLEYPYPPEIKQVDKNCAQYEMTCMMQQNLHFDYWSADLAESRFIETWNKVEHILQTYYTTNNH